MMYAGISMVLAGGLGVITGAIIAAEGSRRLQVHGPGGYLAGRSADEDVRDAGIAVAIITGAVFAAGVPLWSIGARQIVVKTLQTEPTTSPPPPKPAAILRLGPGGASFVASF